MKLDVLTNAKRNIVWGVFDKLISIFCPFIIRTLFIKIIGEELLGLNSLFSSILQVLSIAELGLSNAIIYGMYKPVAENDTYSICAFMRFYKNAYRIIGSIIFFIGLFLIPFLHKFIKNFVIHDYNLYLIYVIYLFNTSISYFLFAHKICLLTVHQREDIISKITIVINFIIYLLQSIAIIWSKNYYFYIIVLPFTTALNNVIKGYLATKLYPEYTCIGNLSKLQISEMKKNIVGLVIGKVCMVSRNSLDSIFISAFLGLITVAIYSNYYSIMATIITILSIIRVSIYSGIGNSVALNSLEKNHNDFELLTFMYAWISGFCTICLLCLYQPLMKVWLGEKLMFPFFTVVLLCIYFYSLSLGDIRSVYSNASGLFWEGKAYTISETCLNFILNYIMGKQWGINGIIAATNISILFINFLWGTSILYKYYFIGYDVKKYFLTHLIYATITFGTAITTLFIANLISIDGFLGLLLKLLICFLISNIIYWSLYRKNDKYVASLNLLRAILTKRKITHLNV